MMDKLNGCSFLIEYDNLLEKYKLFWIKSGLVSKQNFVASLSTIITF